MSSFLNGIKDKAIEIAENQVNERVDLYPVGVDLDEKLDKSPVGEKSSERIQRGVITDSFLELLAGVHADNKDWYASRLIEEAQKVKDGSYDK